jgi:diadenosine tetraphosphate (Ap4A) HIT family hydrolase
MRPEITATMVKFGFPSTLIGDLTWWAALYRPKQVTLGSLILAAKRPVTSFSDLPPETFPDLGEAVRLIERTLAAFSRYEKINYLMLMMVDPHPHFHVIPRYKNPRIYEGVTFTDHGWPGQPALNQAISLPEDAENRAIADLRSLWKSCEGE